MMRCELVICNGTGMRPILFTQHQEQAHFQTDPGKIVKSGKINRMLVKKVDCF